MKQGTEFWYGIKIKGQTKEYIDIELVDKVVFNFDSLVKTYEEGSKDVVYDYENNLFKIYLTQEETLKMQSKIYIDAKVKFYDGTILGVHKVGECIFDSLNKEVI